MVRGYQANKIEIIFEPETSDAKRRRYSKMLHEFCVNPNYITIPELAQFMNCTPKEAGQRMKGCRYQCYGRNKLFLIADVAVKMALREKV
ncbi:MAG: hypothetical protein AB9835_05045 [Eubacteriales bacterium]